MHYRRFHAWTVSPARARAIQQKLRSLVLRDGALATLRAVAGADVAYLESEGVTCAAVVVMGVPGFEVIETVTAESQTRFPYVPGLLSFREAPVLLKAFQKVRSTPDALIVDGQGYAHPRRFGLASHLGLLLDLPTVGCAKSLLVGDYDEPGWQAGASSPLIHRGEVVGCALRTRERVKPVYVSVGHRLSLNAAQTLVLQCVKRYRLPEPVRHAHHLVSEYRRQVKERLGAARGLLPNRERD